MDRRLQHRIERADTMGEAWLELVADLEEVEFRRRCVMRAYGEALQRAPWPMCDGGLYPNSLPANDAVTSRPDPCVVNSVAEFLQGGISHRPVNLPAKRDRVKRWSLLADCCVECGTIERPHVAHGRCKRCYDRRWYRGP